MTHGLQQHARLSCFSLSPSVCSNSCPLSQWCHPTISSSFIPFSSCPQSFPADRVFSNELALHIRWPKYWSLNFSISPSNEYSGLISFRIDWLDLLAVQGTLKSLLQYQSMEASILWCSAFLMVQLSHLYMTTGKNITLTMWIFVGKVMSLLFYMLSRFVIAFLPRIKSLLISWLQSLFRVHCCYLHYYGTSATIKNIRMIPYYQLNFTLCLDFLKFSFLSFFSDPGFYSGYHITLSCHVSLGSSWLLQSLRFVFEVL